MSGSERFLGWLCLWSALASVSCSNPPTTPEPAPAVDAPHTQPDPARATSAPEVVPPQEPGSSSMGKRAGGSGNAEKRENRARFPENLVLHRAEEVSLEGDRSLRVAHAPGGIDHAMIYLHGMCGDSKGADVWIDIATQRATVITVRADVPCPDRPGFKWPQEADAIQLRIDAALAHVKRLREGHLDTNVITLVGYSQGAHRAEKLAAAYPERYTHLVLGGPPTSPDPVLLQNTKSVAILGGELEDTAHMAAGFDALTDAKLRTRFFVLPRAHHGGYGPEGRRVMTEVFAWLFSGAN